MMSQDAIIRQQTTVPRCCICNRKATEISHGSWLCDTCAQKLKKRTAAVKTRC